MPYTSKEGGYTFRIPELAEVARLVESGDLSPARAKADVLATFDAALTESADEHFDGIEEWLAHG